MNQSENPIIKKQLAQEQRKEIMSYPASLARPLLKLGKAQHC
jgi:hypothetical protein